MTTGSHCDIYSMKPTQMLSWILEIQCLVQKLYTKVTPKGLKFMG